MAELPTTKVGTKVLKASKENTHIMQKISVHVNITCQVFLGSLSIVEHWSSGWHMFCSLKLNLNELLKRYS